ncbi:MAG: hypothetical protein I8H79_05750 [Burkholderiales bacterium]|nr:hypothetical protein [Burkholderiales bacterium]MBH1993835.1 hypothetical protein [Burkholderiales bacterium]MBH2069919.1 hypothetical protein [Burkholderiales bacterium]
MIIVNHRLKHFQRHHRGIEMQREKITLGWTGKSAPVVEAPFIEVEALVPVISATPARTVLAVTAWTDPDPVDLCLELWKAWMTGDSDRDLGMKTMRGLNGDGDGYSVDLHEAQQSSDLRIAHATDAMINGLSRVHIWAIYRACSLATVWRFPNNSAVSEMYAARIALAEKLRKNICTSLLF